MADPDRPSLPPGHHFRPIFVNLTVIFFRQAIIFGHFCRLDCCHGRPRPAISSAVPSFSAFFVGLTVVMAGSDRPSLPPGHHYCPFLLAQRSFLSARPSLSAHFVGLTVIFFRQAVILGHFCWLSGLFCPPDHHFCSFLSAWRSIFPAGPSLSAVFAGSTVVMAGPDRPSLPPDHHFRPFLST